VLDWAFLKEMATTSSPPAIPSKRIPSDGLPNFDGNGDLKENIGSNHTPRGRVVGAPMSPVRVNVHSGNWTPSASSAKVEAVETHGRQFSVESDGYMNAQSDPVETQMPVIQDLPYRPSYTTKPTSPAHQSHQSQAAMPSSAASSGSRSPPRSSPPRSSPLRRDNGKPVDGNGVETMGPPVPQFQYHHQSHSSEGNVRIRQPPGPLPNSPSAGQIDAGTSIGRHLTPTLHGHQRPVSAYSDLGPRDRSTSPYMKPGSPAWGGRVPSANSHRSYDGRPISYVDLANVSYPQAPPAPISLDNSQLRSAVGANASLLSTQKTLELYRQNVKKLNDAETQYAFAIFLVQAAQEAGLGQDDGTKPQKRAKSRTRDNSPYGENPQSSPAELLDEAKHILQRLADRSYPFAQYYLADGYASGLFSKGKEDYGTAFPLFTSASKHGHAESGYRAALCYEFGWGTKKDVSKAVQYYRQAASKNHPGAMTRLGRACLSGDLGLNKYREGLKWLKRATESADVQYNAAPYHLALLYVTGYGDDIFKDETYAAQLFTQAADLGHSESCYILGDAYEHGKLSCPRDPALSVHFYTGAAQRGHPAAMMALCAWYMVGAEPVLEKDENEAYEWARQAAECGK
jgi:TPR repeat protein